MTEVSARRQPLTRHTASRDPALPALTSGGPKTTSMMSASRRHSRS